MVTVGGFQTLVAQPKRNNGHVDAGLEKVHRRGVPDDMRRDSLCLQARTEGDGAQHRLPENVGGAVG